MNTYGANSWTSKEDVLQDLEAIGQAISEKYIVRRNGPPPPIREELGDDYNLRFGGTIYSEKTEAPDLDSITHFLRLVNDGDADDEEPVDKDSQLVISKTNISSKLNPLVKEFVPRFSSVPNGNVTEGKASPCKSPKAQKDLPQITDSSINPSKSSKDQKGPTPLDNKAKSVINPCESTKAQTDPIDNSVDNGINRNLKRSSNSPMNSIQHNSKSSKETALELPQKNCFNNQESPKDINGITKELRNRISDTSKSDSPILRRERNVAIANLLKLHSVKPSPASSKSNVSMTNEKEIKLYTPDYFNTVTKVTANEEPVVNVENVEEIKEAKPIDTCAEEACIPESSIQESIAKVKNWLEPKSESETIQIKPKSPLKTGPVVFKKKGANAKSPNGDASAAARTNGAVAQFKPSKYADDLTKKYMERSKESERRQLSIWENVEIELKKKDEIIKKKREANRS